ncbi:oligosaccharide flippase family protein [Psychrobacillus sp. FSL H8-0483]|uniref:lipopolysaccharide biosynthesis protein n=1 Tax=Psychrobacillus sp. FSL H8-0483 TaxID=2921389 RepID=UPI003159A8E0
MKEIKKSKKNSFFKNVLIITGGTATAQLINTLLTPVITRIYSPEEFGILTVYLAILGIIAITGSLKFDLGIAIAEDDEKAINVVALSIIVLVMYVSSITLILYFWGDNLLELFSSTVIIKYKFLIPLGILFTGLYNIFTQWALRNRNYNSISKTKLNQSLIQNIFTISFGLFHLGPIGLILGNIFGQSSGIGTLSAPLIKEDKYLFNKINIKYILWCAKRYVRFPLYTAPSQFLNIAGLQLPILFMTSLFGSSVVGFYGLANIIVSLPINLIGRSVSDVFYGEAARIGRTSPNDLKKISNNLFKKLILIGLIPLIILLMFGPSLFAFVFGQEWYTSGVYARIIAFLIFARLAFTPITRVFSIYEKQKDELFLDIFRIIMVLLVFALSKIFLLNSYGFVGLYTIAMSIVYIIGFLWARKVINDEVKKVELKC